MQPKSAFARKFMSEIRVSFDTRSFLPLSTELKFSDGSGMRNDFTNGRINLPLAEDLFEPKLEPDFKIVEPMK
jgi:outer membrane lipoprotein-sorting protein